MAAVGLAPVVDARENLAVGFHAVQRGGLLYIKTAELEPFVRSQVGKRLAKEGFQVVALSESAPPSPPRRTVVVAILSAEHSSKEGVTFKLQTASAEIRVRVVDPLGRELFAHSYAGATGLGRTLGGGFGVNWRALWKHFPFQPSTSEVMNEVVGDEVAGAIDAAVAKMCNDPAFIAAITPPEPTALSPPTQPLSHSTPPQR